MRLSETCPPFVDVLHSALIFLRTIMHPGTFDGSTLHHYFRSKVPVVSVSKTRYPHCSVLIGSRNRFERDFTIE